MKPMDRAASKQSPSLAGKCMIAIHPLFCWTHETGRHNIQLPSNNSPQTNTRPSVFVSVSAQCGSHKCPSQLMYSKSHDRHRRMCRHEWRGAHLLSGRTWCVCVPAAGVELCCRTITVWARCKRQGSAAARTQLPP